MVEADLALWFKGKKKKFVFQFRLPRGKVWSFCTLGPL